jgi:hypothetical protein
MKTLAAFGIGALIGAAIAIRLAAKVSDDIERAAAKALEIARQTNEVAAHLNDQVQTIRGAVYAGVRAFKEPGTQCTH